MAVRKLAISSAAQGICDTLASCGVHGTDEGVWTVELADAGVRRRRLSGRVSGGKDRNDSNQHGGASLYTVVTMDPDDEVTCLPSAAVVCFLDC